MRICRIDVLWCNAILINYKNIARVTLGRGNKYVNS